ncbi:MAG TPA: rhomboid family intramembrane serine protease [Dongiaceae bacterium]|nr:rhomboid family intramembrane serine protease [Dongiaceae bacterium]
MHYRRGPVASGIMGFPPAISQLVLINAIIFLVQMLLPESALYHILGTAVPKIPNALGLVPYQVVHGMVWQLATYMFLHGGVMHILLNMFYLVMFGSDLERWWGSREFVKYYFICGIGAGLIQVLTTYAFHWNPLVPVIGASGAVFGVLIAYAMAFPNRQILLWFVIPISARVLITIFAFIELAMTVEYRGGDGVARFAHLGGMLVGYLYLKQESIGWRIKKLLGEGHRPSRRRSRRDHDADMQSTIDEILEKISREGMGSLSEEEKQLLHESAERARRKQQGLD